MKRRDCKIGTKVRYRFYDPVKKKSYSRDGVIAKSPHPNIALPFDSERLWVKWDNDFFSSGDFISPSLLTRRF